jgi:hypothetical protein
MIVFLSVSHLIQFVGLTKYLILKFLNIEF